ncbi:MAG: T9SS type A sorting domain-containing protein [Bacteroidota bacterium]
MKKAIIIVFCTFLAEIGFTQSNIPNGFLENWYNTVVNANLNFDQPGVGPDDNWITTLNELATIAPPIGPGPVTAFRTTDTHSGTYACKLVSQNFILVPTDVFIPGMLGTAKLNMTSSNAILGRHCEGCRPLSLSGWYKYEPVNGDSATVVILLSKWNPSTHKRDTIGYGRFFQKQAVSEYTQFTLPVNYRNNNAPDSITILTISSGGFNVVNFMQSHGQVGSTMYIDDLMLEYPAGIRQNLMPDVMVSVYPNPTSNNLHVELTMDVVNGLFQVYNMEGRMMTSLSLESKTGTLTVSSFPAGTYLYKLVSGKEVLNTGSFIVKR